MRQRPERVAKRNYYYCYQRAEQRRFDIEHGLQKLEDAAIPVLKMLRDGNFRLSGDDRLTFAGYIALSFTRVPTFERSVNRVASFLYANQLERASKDAEIMQLAARNHFEETGENITADQFRNRLIGGSIQVTQQSRNWSLKQMLEVMLDLQLVIAKMNWTFLLADKEDPGFLTSDNPVCLYDPDGSSFGAVGFSSSPGAYFTFPVSRGVCLLARHISGPRVSESSASKIREVNTATIERSDTQIYAPFKSDKVQTLINRTAHFKAKPSKILFRKGRVVEEQR